MEFINIHVIIDNRNFGFTRIVIAIVSTTIYSNILIKQLTAIQFNILK